MLITFWILALLLVISGIAVIAFKNPIHSALALIMNLLCVAAVFAALGAHFLAAVQIVVYAGAIMVLVMFVLMLLNTKREPLDRFKPLYVVCALLLAAFFTFVLGGEFLRVFGNAAIPVDGGTLGTVKSIGALLYTQYIFAFEAASVLIMAAIVGAVMLAKRKYRDVTLAPRS